MAWLPFPWLGFLALSSGMAGLALFLLVSTWLMDPELRAQYRFRRNFYVACWLWASMWLLAAPTYLITLCIKGHSRAACLMGFLIFMVVYFAARRRIGRKEPTDGKDT